MSEWYHLGKWIEPTLGAEVWIEYAHVAQQFYKQKLDQKILYINGDFFLSKHDADIFHNEGYEAAKNHDLKFFEKIISEIKKVTKKVSEDVFKISLVDFLEEYKELTGVWMSLNVLSTGVEKYVRETNSIAFDIATGLTIEKPLTFQQLDEMRELKKEIGENSFNPEKIPRKIFLKLTDHIKKYVWLGSHHFNYGEFNIDKLFEQIKSDKPKTLYENKIDKELSYLIKLVDILGFIRFKSAETSGYLTYHLHKPLENLAKKHNLTYLDMVEHTIDEIRREKLSKKIAEHRRNIIGFAFDGKKTRLLSDDEVKNYQKELFTQLDENVTEFKGLIANKGYAKGKVKIVTHPKQMAGFEEGMVLVAYETTPDVVLAMRKAVGIVTDFGGITSHAAIVSRELGKPCIVGTKIATKVLKDGDMVEVDANKGVVRKIE